MISEKAKCCGLLPFAVCVVLLGLSIVFQAIHTRCLVERITEQENRIRTLERNWQVAIQAAANTAYQTNTKHSNPEIDREEVLGSNNHLKTDQTHVGPKTETWPKYKDSTMVSKQIRLQKYFL